MKQLMLSLIAVLFLGTGVYGQESNHKGFDPKDLIIISPTVPENPIDGKVFSKNLGKKETASNTIDIVLYFKKINDYIAFDIDENGKIVNIFTSPKSEKIVTEVTNRALEDGGLADCYKSTATDGTTFGDICAFAACLYDELT